MTGLLGDTATKRSLILHLATGCACLGLASVLFSVALVTLVMRDTRDWFVPSAGPGFLRPGELSDLYVLEQAGPMASLQGTWTAETLPLVQDNFKRLLDPAARKIYEEKTAPEERRVVKENKIVLSQFVVTGAEIVKRHGMRRRVLVHGIRTLYIGSTPSAEAVTIDLGLEPETSQGRPTGLKIMALVPSHPLKIAGR